MDWPASGARDREYTHAAPRCSMTEALRRGLPWAGLRMALQAIRRRGEGRSGRGCRDEAARDAGGAGRGRERRGVVPVGRAVLAGVAGASARVRGAEPEAGGAVRDELRERILRLHAETGWGASRIANEAGTSPRTVRRVVSADAAQRDRGASLRWKRANPEHCRRLNEAKRRRDNPHDCTRCGAWIAEAGLAVTVAGARPTAGAASHDRSGCGLRGRR
jgi:hypothetical protein